MAEMGPESSTGRKDVDDKIEYGKQDARSPVGTDSHGAMTYLGCSRARFDALRRLGIVKELCRNWFAYDDLDDALRRIREERDKEKQRDEIKPKGLFSEEPARALGGKRGRPDYRPTKDILRKIQGGGGKGGG